MKNEYEIVNELGPRNWLDVVAGEAVLLGHMVNDSVLVVKGTQLAARVRETSYDSDDFGEVIGLGKSLVEMVKEARKEVQSMEYLDAIFVGSERDKDCFEWEYDFVYANGKYQIILLLPEYYDRYKLVSTEKVRVETAVRSVWANPKFDELPVVEWSFVCNDQDFLNKSVCNERKEEVYKSVDFSHEGAVKRGRYEYYYFTDFDLALKAWKGVREALFISSQKR